MKHRQAGCTQELSAAKAGISIRSGRRIDKDEKSNRTAHHWRTRKDPFEAVWASEIEPLLENQLDLTGITLWDYLDEQHPGQYPEKLLRTLQRRVKHWLATRGPDKEVMFRQSVPAGHQGLSDFTHPNTVITRLPGSRLITYCINFDWPTVVGDMCILCGVEKVTAPWPMVCKMHCVH